jgi:hypothetical protein
MLGLLVAAPSVAALLCWRAWVRPLSGQALDFITHDSFFSALLEGLEPGRRAALPARIESLLAGMLPKLGALGLVASVGAVVVTITLGRFLGRTLRAEDPPGRPLPTVLPWRLPILAFVAGLAAHLHSLRQSFNTDEAAAVLHATQSWWSWADTRIGWQTHMGGELLFRLSTSLLGKTEWAAHLPAALVSSAGLALCAVWVRRRAGTVSAVLTTGLLCALPLWAEQATLARGYGLLFASGMLGLWALDRILDDSAQGQEVSTLAALGFAHLSGVLAHLFFAFFSVATLGLLVWHALRRRSALAAAGVLWVLVGVALVVPLYLPGLPATLFQSGGASALPASVVPLRFVEALGFDLHGAPEWIAFAIILGLIVLGTVMLAPAARRRFSVLLLVGIGLPLLLRPVYFYPRFFLHLTPLLFVATLPLAAALRRVEVSWRVPLALVAAVAVWAWPQPWRHLPAADLRGACQSARRLVRPGEAIFVESFYTAIRVCLDGVPTHVAPLGRQMPPDARVLISGNSHGALPLAYPGYHVVERIPGREIDMEIYAIDGR